MSRITVLGMGAMGSRMASNLLKAGHVVTVWNRSEAKTIPLVEQGAIAQPTPRSAVQNAEVVIAMVHGDEASREIWLNETTGALAGLPSGSIAIESSTLTVEWTRSLAQQVHHQNELAQNASGQNASGQNIAFLDAPVAGSLPQAEAAQLIYFVGGDATTLERVQPILQSLGSAVHYTGTAGNGMAIKLAVNTLFGVQAAAIAELIGFLKGCGLAPASAVDVLSATPVCSPAAKALASAMVAHKFAPLFPIDLVAKDLSYLATTAQANEAEVPVGDRALTIFQNAIQKGYGADNITGVAQLYE